MRIGRAGTSDGGVTADELNLRVRRQAAVATFTLFALRSRRITTTVERAVEVVSELLCAPTAALMQIMGPGRTAVVHRGGPIASTSGDVPDVGADLLATQLYTAPGGADENPESSPARARGHAAASGRAQLSASVLVEGQPWGLLLVSDAETRAFSRAEADFVQAIAAVLGAALERERIDKRHAALADFGRFALECPDLAVTIERAVDVLTSVLEAPMAAAVRVSRRPATLAIVQASGPVGPQVGHEYEVDPRLAAEMLTPNPLIVEDWRSDDRFSTPLLPRSAPSIATMAAAVQVGERIWGRLVVSDTRPRHFSPHEIRAVATLAATLGAALERKRREWSQAGAGLLSAAQQNRTPPGSTAEVALLDRDGVIVWVNRAWQDFCRDNSGDPARTGVGVSYLAQCDAAGDPLAAEVAVAIREALSGGLPAPLAIMIPCHGPEQVRWFDLLISSRLDDGGDCLGAAVTLSPTLP